MAFNSQGNNKYKNDTNTRGIQFKNKDGFDPSTLVTGFWNEFLSLKIHPALPKDKQSETEIYDYEKAVNTALSMDKVAVLLKKMNEDILPAIEKEEEATVGIVVGGTSLVVVSTGVKMMGSVRPYIAIHKGLDEKTKKPEMSIWYEFKSIFTVDDYNHETGEFEVNAGQQAEVLLFINILEATLEAMTQAQSHSGRAVNKFFNDKVLNGINGLCEKTGATPSSQSNYSGGFKKSGDVFSSKQYNSNSNSNSYGDDFENQSMNKVDNMSDIDSFMGN